MKVRKLKHRLLRDPRRARFLKTTAQFERFALKVCKNSTFGKLGPKPALYDFEAKRAELREEYNSGSDSVGDGE